MFVELNGGDWEANPPDVDEAEAAMLFIAAGEVDETLDCRLAPRANPISRLTRGPLGTRADRARSMPPTVSWGVDEGALQPASRDLETLPHAD